MKQLIVLASALLPLLGLAEPGACDGGAYLNPQTIRGETASQSSLADSELIGFLAPSGLPTKPLQSIKKAEDLGQTGRKPPCWIYGNPVVGLGTVGGYRAAVINADPIQPAVLVITTLPAPPDSPPVALKNLPPAEQKSVLEQLSRSLCIGIASGVTTAIVKAGHLCARVEQVAPQSGLGQQMLLSKAAYMWDESAWVGLVTREGSAMRSSMKGLAGRSDKIHQVKLIVVPSKATSFGYGLFVHPSMPEATVRKAVDTFKGLTAPSKSLATALDLGEKFNFAVPSAEQIEAVSAAIGLGK